MKKFKLLLAAFVATLFAFAGVKASAYTITIDNVSDNHTYEAYQVFGGDLAKTTEKDANAPRLSNIHWGSGVNEFTYDGESDAAKIAEKLSGQKEDSDDAKAFSKLAGANLKEFGEAEKAAKDGQDFATAKSENGKAVLTVSEPGYYLVKDKDGTQDGNDAAYTRFMMEVVGDVTAQVKNDKPTVQKKVKETNDSTGETTDWQDAADYDFDDDVPFQLTATLPSNFDDYSEYYLEFSDTLSKGLTYNKDAKVFLVNGENKTDITSSFTIAEDGSSFKINNLKSISGVTASSKIVVEYTAKLGSNAVIGSEGNPNTVKLVYSNNPNYEGKGEESPKGNTPEKNVKVFTYQTIINKVDQYGKALPGAEFTLVKKNKDGSTKNVDVVKNAEGTSFTFKGLDAGNYVLEETTTPDGYNTIKPIEFTINAEYDVKSDDPQLTKLSGDVTSGVAKFDANKADGSLKADIVNRKGSLLPSTGGMGTTILYVIGSILVLVAAVLLITKKRMDAAK
ncbi:Cna protein B-type domain-containing protein [Streptococcus equinus]|uniref:isopeptide-forming domain-containing fimbrial protein n=1 Tax=Streptococcus equinus TaxID=1335 RepID=UPI000F6B9722|nr:isopeptide-forming domain-containing fimbrial protein [Streptococcus equinus]VED93237.1 Cna protein B-type domain-containing protein [Streptococcus equinus]VTS91243.1 Cna protein B-type domain-containing protein [Streptococcus equinus]